jgi:hypothetical protein
LLRKLQSECATTRASSSVKGREVLEVSGETVGQCLGHLVILVPALKDVFFNEAGNRLHQHINVDVNKESVNAERVLGKKVKGGDEVRVMLKRH